MPPHSSWSEGASPGYVKTEFPAHLPLTPSGGQMGSPAAAQRGGVLPPGRWQHLHIAGSSLGGGGGALLSLASGASMMQFWEGSFVLGWETQVHKEPRVFIFTHSYTQSSHTHTLILPQHTRHLQTTKSQVYRTTQWSRVSHTLLHMHREACIQAHILEAT